MSFNHCIQHTSLDLLKFVILSSFKLLRSKIIYFRLPPDSDILRVKWHNFDLLNGGKNQFIPQN